MPFVIAEPVPDSIVGNTCFWHFDTLGYHQQWVAQVVLGAPGFQAIGDTVHHTLLAYADDGFGNLALVGSDPWQAVVACSYDPNDKLVSPSGVGPYHATPGDTEWLTYTIRFQNTGTDTAFTVMIEDQLSQHLQWGTLQFLGSSHELTGLTWTAGEGDVPVRQHPIAGQQRERPRIPRLRQIPHLATARSTAPHAHREQCRHLLRPEPTGDHEQHIEHHGGL